MELLGDADEDSPISYRFVFPESNAAEQSPDVLVDEKVLVGEGGVQSECLAEVETVKQHYAAVVDQLLEERKGYLSQTVEIEETSKGCNEIGETRGKKEVLEIFTGSAFNTA